MKVNRQPVTRCEPAFHERPSFNIIASLGHAVFELQVGRESTVVSLGSRDSGFGSRVSLRDGVIQY